jgi:hypothetical protein
MVNKVSGEITASIFSAEYLDSSDTSVTNYKIGQRHKWEDHNTFGNVSKCLTEALRNKGCDEIWGNSTFQDPEDDTRNKDCDMCFAATVLFGIKSLL